MNAMFDHFASTLSGPVTMDAVAPLAVDGVIGVKHLGFTVDAAPATMAAEEGPSLRAALG